MHLIPPLHNPENSKWKCYLFGTRKIKKENHEFESGIVWHPIKGEEPNWFWRWMQYLCFGNKWVKNK